MHTGLDRPLQDIDDLKDSCGHCCLLKLIADMFFVERVPCTGYNSNYVRTSVCRIVEACNRYNILVSYHETKANLAAAMELIGLGPKDYKMRTTKVSKRVYYNATGVDMYKTELLKEVEYCVVYEFRRCLLFRNLPEYRFKV